MATVKVLFFGKLTDITGNEQLTIEGIDYSNQLIENLEFKFPKIKNNIYSIAVNNKMIFNSIKLENGDVIALMPPFSGG